ncbi:MAG: HAMP domain-containing histidine kinase [Bacteroidales bacterium]|nr:HAMP domain-containing histidine kinase [Bacteroidales bacterium]
MGKRKLKLLSKAVIFYLFFTAVSFIISAVILQNEADKHMHRILERRLEHREGYIEHKLEKNPRKMQEADFASVEKVDRIPENFDPVYTDTVMVNQRTQRENIYRKKTTYVTVNGNHYRLEITKEADELYGFRDDVFHIVLPVFIVLVVAIFLVNYLLSGYLLDPFRRILKQMSLYRIGQSGSLDHIKTSTFEFDKLKQLYENMRQRIEDDYYQLKEYTENMSHELQTPLSIIQNKTESLLSANDLKPGQAKQLKAIYEETQQLSRMGRALNLITQIENQEFKNIQTITTAPVIRSHVDKIWEIAEMKQLGIQTNLNEQHTLTIDAGLLDILVRNLIKNAIRYSHPSTIIQIETGEEYFRVINQGDEPEFPEEEVFKRFRKGNRHKSLGLGLAIAKKICEVSGLHIDYKYRDGKHIFTVTPLDNA